MNTDNGQSSDQPDNTAANDAAITALRQVAPSNPAAVARIAARFGFDQPDRVPVDPRALDRKRKSAGLQATDLVSALRAAGIDASAAQIRGWLTSKATITLPRSTVTALTGIVGADATSFTTEPDNKASIVEKFVRGPRFRELVADVARRTGEAFDALASSTQQQLGAAAYRADDLDEEQLVEMVRAVLDDGHPT